MGGVEGSIGGVEKLGEEGSLGCRGLVAGDAVFPGCGRRNTFEFSPCSNAPFEICWVKEEERSREPGSGDDGERAGIATGLFKSTFAGSTGGTVTRRPGIP